MAILSLFLDRLKVDKLSKSMFFLLFFYIQKNVNAVGNITYKDNEHLAVKCIVLHGLGKGGVLFEKMVNDMVSANMWVSRDTFRCYHGHRCLSSAWHTVL